MDEKEIAAALGVEMPSVEEGAREQEIAAPANENTPMDGANEQSAAASADIQEPPSGVTDEGETQGETQTPEENSKFAEYRRKSHAERDAAVKEAVEKANAENEARWKQFFERAGITNPINNQAITSYEDFERYEAQRAAGELADRISRGEASGSDIASEIERQAQKRAAAISEERIQQRVQMEQNIKRQVDAIHAIDPKINSVQDLLTMDGADKFREYVKRGYTFEDAYYLTHRADIEQKKLDAAAQQAVNSQRGKSHLTATKTQSGGMVDVPSDVMAEFQLFNPNATPAEIQAYYNKYLKSKR